MNAQYTPSSARSCLVASSMAFVISAAQFSAVAVGLTGDDVSTLLSQHNQVLAQATLGRQVTLVARGEPVER